MALKHLSELLLRLPFPTAPVQFCLPAHKVTYILTPKHIETYRIVGDGMNSMLTLGEAASFLGVSRKKMWSLVKDKQILAHTSPLDRRKKLFKKSDLEKLKEAFA